MTIDGLDSLIASSPSPLILMEGRRRLPPAYYAPAAATGRFLAARYPDAWFRSGNAKGSDEAFSKGVAKVDATRLQIVAPYRSRRMKERFSGARYGSPEAMPPAVVDDITARTAAASPGNKSLVKQFGGTGRSAAKAACLVRVCRDENIPTIFQDSWAAWVSSATH